MGRRTLKTVGLASSVLVVELGAIPQMETQSQIPYPDMAALDGYPMPD